MSLNESAAFHVENGSHPIFDEDIQDAERLLIEGLSMLEGKRFSRLGLSCDVWRINRGATCWHITHNVINRLHPY